MPSLSLPAQQVRTYHRHDLRTLTYVVLDEANGGIIRNLSYEGVAVQAVAALRQGQTVRVRFELRHPRIRVEARGEVVWANPSGQCGIRFLDLPPRMVRQVNEWIFGNILECIPRDSPYMGPVFGASPLISVAAVGDDGLLISSTPRKVIAIDPRAQPVDEMDEEGVDALSASPASDWLSQPLSERNLAWAIDGLVMVAAFLLFSLVFLSVTHELPRWPLSLGVGLGLAIFVPVFYCGFFHTFGSASLGTRLAKLAGWNSENNEEEVEGPDRFR